MTDSALPALESHAIAPSRALPFPGLVGIFLGASLCLHLAGAVYFAFGDSLQAAVSVLFGQFLLGLSILRLVDGAFVFQDIRLFFLIFFFFYGATLPMVVAFGLQGGTAGLAGAAFMYATGMFAFNFVQWWYRQPWHDVPPESFARYRPSFANAVLVFLGFVWIISYIKSRSIPLSGGIDRDRANWVATQVWVVSMFAMNGLVMYGFIGWNQLTRKAKVVLVLTVISFVLLQISFGNRRDFLPMLIFLAGVTAARRHSVIRFWTVLLGILAFAGLTILGILRQVIAAPVLLASDPVTILVTQSEFVSPIQTLIYYVAKPHALRFGWTYLTAPLLLIPRAFWPGKPESLSLQFMRDAFGTTEIMGYAYTPVTEAVLNFGLVGPAIFFAILSILMVKLVKNADLRPGLYFICFSVVVDFNRGDVPGTFYQVVCIGAAFWFMHFLSRVRWAPRILRATFPEAPPVND
ncbi:MAG: oligosaccharide repeat unit polymerase [Gemmatimonadaceae bacterium]